jgi:hypothetical protein
VNVRRFAAGVAVTIALLGAPVAASADTPEPVAPVTSNQSEVTLAETGAGDRALIALGVVGGVLLVGAGAVMAVHTGRSRSRH